MAQRRRSRPTVKGGDGANIINGGAGDDVVEGGGGADAMTGGQGNDWLSYESSASGVTISLTANVGKGGDALNDTHVGFEHVRGGAGADVLTGDAGDNRLEGMGGNDTLKGGAGADYLIGGGGTNLLTGGTGSDTFVMSAVGLISADQIFDFKIGADKIDLSAFAGTIDDFTDVQGFMSDFGVGTRIAFSEGMMTSHTITLLNVAIANLSASDFLFA